MSEANRRTFLSWLSKSGLALTAVGATGALPTVASAERPSVLVFTNATLIDGTGAGPRPNTTIVVAGNRIAAVGHHGVAPPAGIRVVDLRGKYVLPGLWDMHGHTLGIEKILSPLFAVNGVTGVREMWGNPFVHAVRERIRSGELFGPRMVVGSNVIDGPDSLVAQFGTPAEVRTVDEARAAVRQAKRERAEFVKAYSNLRADTFAAVVDEARRVGLPVSGHVPDRISVVEASDAGMRTQEHMYALYVDVSRERDEIRRQIIAEEPADPTKPIDWFVAMRMLERRAAKSYDPRRAAEVYAALRRNDTRLTPTLTVLRLFTFPPEVIKDDPRVKYMPPWVKEKRWDPQLTPKTPEQLAEDRAFFEASLRMLKDAYDAGVQVVTGTDGGFTAPYIFPGFGVHDELGLMVQTGLTPMQAILAATRDAARTLDMQHVSGTVAPGKFADLLVLDDNPLADIRNTTRIHAVVVNGRHIDRSERERILAEVEEEAKRTPEPPVQLASCCTPAR